MNVKMTDFLTSSNFLGYFEAMNPNFNQEMKLTSYFPVQRITGLDFSYIKGREEIPVMITPSAFNVESIIIDRGGFDSAKGELPLFKNKKALGERERQELVTFLKANSENSIDTKVNQIFDDSQSLMTGAMWTQELLRSRVLMDGKINIEYNGSKVDVDYGVGVDQKHTVDLTDALTNPVVTLRDIADSAEERTGWRPNEYIMNRKMYNKFRDHPLVNEALKGTAGTLVVTDTMFNAYMREIAGLNVIVYSKKIKAVDGTSIDLIEDEKSTMFYNTTLGKVLAGTSPSEFDANELGATVDVSTDSNGITVCSWSDYDPIRLYTGVEMVCLPTFTGANLVDLVALTV